MRKDITVAAMPRTTRGKNAARRLRAALHSPAIVYGAGKEPVAVTVDPKEINRILHSPSGHNTVFNLDIQGIENTPAMIVASQHDPVSEKLLHADLLRIDLTKRMAVKVAVHLKGDPKGVKQQGGILEVVTREIEIECLPDDIPEHLTGDVSHLMIGQSLRAQEIPLSGSIKLLAHADQVIAHVVGQRVEAAAEPAAAEPAAAEPELIKKGKKEGEAEGEKKAEKKK
jgi:large subunit ribosomal protein L25